MSTHTLRPLLFWPPTSPEPDHNSNNVLAKRARERPHQIAGTFLSGDRFWCDLYRLFQKQLRREATGTNSLATPASPAAVARLSRNASRSLGDVVGRDATKRG